MTNAKGVRLCADCRSPLVVGVVNGQDYCLLHLSTAAAEVELDTEPEHQPFSMSAEAEEQRARAGSRNLPEFNIFDAMAQVDSKAATVTEWSIEGAERERMIEKLKAAGKVAPAGGNHRGH